jgi:hypothetical protein
MKPDSANGPEEKALREERKKSLAKRVRRALARV